MTGANVVVENVIPHKLRTAIRFLDDAAERESSYFVELAEDEIKEILDYLAMTNPYHDFIPVGMKIVGSFEESFEKGTSEPLNVAYSTMKRYLEENK